ncbi:MAG TPA: pilus assembly protein PilM, partial [Thermaerobacter sp.]
ARGLLVASLPAEESVFRIVELPVLRPREVPAALRWELQRILPFSVDEGVFDYAELPSGPPGAAGPGPGGEGDLPRRRYAVSGGLEEAVQRRLARLRELGIRPTVLEPEWVTLWRLATDLAGDEAALCGVVDLGAAGTRLVLVDAAGVPVVFHRSPVGGRALDRELASALGTTPEEAEQLKFTELASDLGPLSASTALAELAGDLARALRRAQREVPLGAMEVWAVGGGALWPALRAALVGALDLELRVPGSSDVPTRSPLAALDPRWVLAGALARWYLARTAARRERQRHRRIGRGNRRQAATPRGIAIEGRDRGP